MALQDEERRRFQVCSVAWFPDFAHPQDGEWGGSRVLDLENPYHGLATGSMNSEQPCTPLGYKGAGPYIAMASHTPSHSHTVHRYMPVKTTIVSVGRFVECEFVHTSNRSAVMREEAHMSIDKESSRKKKHKLTLYVYRAL
jgi:hypothetical protein